MIDNTWLGFEHLAEKIFAELHPQATVMHNDKILGQISGILRQIDVSIRAKVEGQEILVIINTKYWSKPADITTIGKFASVVEDVQATKGIFICRSGFAEIIKQYALRKGIELLNIYDAQSKKWNLEIKLPIIGWNITSKMAAM